MYLFVICYASLSNHPVESSGAFITIDVIIVDKEKQSVTRQLQLSCNEDPAIPSQHFCEAAQLPNPNDCTTLHRYARNRWQAACWTQEERQPRHGIAGSTSGSCPTYDNNDQDQHLPLVFAPFTEVSEGLSTSGGIFTMVEDGDVPIWEEPPDLLREMAADAMGKNE